MLDMQEQMNQKVDSDWRNQGFEWYRAIWVECAELMDHYGWKWWKHQSPDQEQIKLELVDIWHFGLSQMLASGDKPSKLSKKIVEELSEPKQYGDFLAGVEAFTTEVLAERTFPVAGFAGLAKLVDMDINDLYQRYVGKNVLNFFRQDNGYKDGSYLKIWRGREDNEHLVEVLTEIDPSESNYRDQIYKALTQRYSEFGD
ncbi:MAG: dUTP diphosphatase [Proteobacteria bacterium]|nr:dUTP diphosphatase [Pseudomonadota bacterium]